MLIKSQENPNLSKTQIENTRKLQAEKLATSLTLMYLKKYIKKI